MQTSVGQCLGLALISAVKPKNSAQKFINGGVPIFAIAPINQIAVIKGARINKPEFK